MEGLLGIDLVRPRTRSGLRVGSMARRMNKQNLNKKPLINVETGRRLPHRLSDSPVVVVIVASIIRTNNDPTVVMRVPILLNIWSRSQFVVGISKFTRVIKVLITNIRYRRFHIACPVTN